MDLPNENILDVFFPETYGQPVAPENRRIDEDQHGGLMIDLNATHQLELMRQMQLDNLLLSAGDGHHNNNNNLPPIVLVRRQELKSSKFWYYLGTLLLMGSWLLKSFLCYFGIELKSANLLGISYNTHFNILQWAILMASYWYKASHN